MEKDASITLRLPRELKDALAAAAEREGRSTSNLVQRILQDWASKPQRKAKA
jgi:hypothetical protein